MLHVHGVYIKLRCKPLNTVERGSLNIFIISDMIDTAGKSVVFLEVHVELICFRKEIFSIKTFVNYFCVDFGCPN